MECPSTGSERIGCLYQNMKTQIPLPYHDYIFTRLWSSHPDNDFSVLNTSEVENFYFKTIAMSPPNVLVANEAEFLIKHKNEGWRFSFINVVITSVYHQNIRMFISRGEDWPRRIVELQMRIPRLIVLDWHNIDNITIGCVNPGGDDCGYVAYDNFVLD